MPSVLPVIRAILLWSSRWVSCVVASFDEDIPPETKKDSETGRRRRHDDGDLAAARAASIIVVVDDDDDDDDDDKRQSPRCIAARDTHDVHAVVAFILVAN